jgi:hypothetical protein
MTNAGMREMTDLFAALSRSPFRRRFRLGPREQAYLARRGMDTVMAHARQFITERLAPAQPPHDGRQTPMRGHPVFIAQHVTATCCRGCLAKWHGIKAGRALSEQEVQHVLTVLHQWLAAQQLAGRGETTLWGP